MAVELGGVSVRHGTVVAVDEISSRIGVGERVALVGPSGAGKTTLLALTAGLVRPTGGEVAVFGTDLSTLTGRRLRRHRSRVGLVGQHLELALALRVVHNVNAGRLGRWSTLPALASLVRPAGREGVVGVLDAVGLGDRVDARTGDLSGGERQRVAVARVLRQRPDLLLADEPTSSVDPAFSDRVMGLLTSPDARGVDGQPRTVVVSAHDPQLARRHVDRMIGLRDGRVTFDRPAGEVTDDELTDLYR